MYNNEYLQKELERIEEGISINTKEKNINTKKDILAKYINSLIIPFEILMFVIIAATTTNPAMFYIMLAVMLPVTFGIGKGLSLLFCGTKKNRKLNEKRINDHIDELEKARIIADYNRRKAMKK